MREVARTPARRSVGAEASEAVSVVAAPPFMVDYALEYAARNIPVFPCQPHGKRPLTEHGFKDATTDADVVREWWSVERWCDANIGIPTGIAFDVLDIERDHGVDGFAELERAVGADANLGHVPIARTGRGVHVLYEPTGVGNRAGVVPGVDWRGDGGYVIAVPSLHANGVEYAWEHEGTIPPPPVPDWLRALLVPNDHAQNRRVTDVQEHAGTGSRWSRFAQPKSAKYAAAALDAEARAVAEAAVGIRNDRLNRSTHTLARLEVAPSTIEAVMLAAARDAGLSEHEALGTISSALRARGLA
jgi:Bifunctional DNA primase/polymerase, N-terminal